MITLLLVTLLMQVPDSLTITFIEDEGQDNPIGIIGITPQVGDTWNDGDLRPLPRSRSYHELGDTLYIGEVADNDTLPTFVIDPGWFVIEEPGNFQREFYNNHYDDFGVMVNGQFYVRPEEPKPPWWETEGGRFKRNAVFTVVGVVVGFIVGMLITMPEE